MPRLLVVVLMSVIVGGCSSKAPTDAEMLAVFQHRKIQFEQLRNLLCANNGRRVVMMEPEWSDPKVSEDEKAKLYRLYREIGAKGAYYDGDCSFRIAVWSVGLAGSGDYKYYSYRPSASSSHKASVLSTLDNLDPKSETVEFYLRPIEGDWYLAFDHWP